MPASCIALLVVVQDLQDDDDVRVVAELPIRPALGKVHIGIGAIAKFFISDYFKIRQLDTALRDVRAGRAQLSQPQLETVRTLADAKFIDSCPFLPCDRTWRGLRGWN